MQLASFTQPTQTPIERFRDAVRTASEEESGVGWTMTAWIVAMIKRGYTPADITEVIIVGWDAVEVPPGRGIICLKSVDEYYCPNGERISVASDPAEPAPPGEEPAPADEGPAVSDTRVYEQVFGPDTPAIFNLTSGQFSLVVSGTGTEATVTLSVNQVSSWAADGNDPACENPSSWSSTATVEVADGRVDATIPGTFDVSGGTCPDGYVSTGSEDTPFRLTLDLGGAQAQGNLVLSSEAYDLLGFVLDVPIEADLVVAS